MPKKLFQIGNTPCISIGNGSKLCFIMGPGSFYLKNLILGSDIGETHTLLTCDYHWITNPNKAAAQITLNELLEFNHNIITEIRKKFNVPKIGILSFSAPACLGIKYAEKYHEDVSWLQVVGASFDAIDPSFKLSDQLFKRNASVERVKKYENEQKICSLIEQSLDDTGLYFTDDDYYLNSDNKRCLKANAKWLLETISFYQKAFFHDTEQYRQCLIEHWQSNIFSQTICAQFRGDFFNNIFPTINSLETLKILSKRNIPIQIFSGEEDYITPLSQTSQNELNLINNVKLITYKNCGHYAYIENKEKFYLDFLNFSKQAD